MTKLGRPDIRIRRPQNEKKKKKIKDEINKRGGNELCNSTLSLRESQFLHDFEISMASFSLTLLPDFLFLFQPFSAKLIVQ